MQLTIENKKNAVILFNGVWCIGYLPGDKYCASQS